MLATFILTIFQPLIILLREIHVSWLYVDLIDFQSHLLFNSLLVKINFCRNKPYVST